MRLRVSVLPALLVCFATGMSGERAAARAADREPAKSQAKPVPVNMHDFMEGMFQSPYKRLKAAMAAEPKDNAGWKAIRSDALILAEGGNLLLMRLPDSNVDQWTKYSVDSRDAGAALVKAGKAKDFAKAKEAYHAMLNHCNACHKQFEEGKHILKP
ncbi:MAG: cytochrome c [Gemmataceae bacterium]|nr:cytochrome c [Gemmataceae bacterium]